jgi:Family of unknown function (DUF6526)
MSKTAQSFENHAMMVPGYHYWATGMVMLPTLFFAYRTVTAFSLDALALLVFCVGVVLTGLYARLFPLGVQDRVIRVEERRRMERLLPDDLQGRISEFTIDQCVALRFASDGELPELARRVLEEGLADRKSIKRLVEHWRADHSRI